MALSAHPSQNPDSSPNLCCEVWKKKCSKLQEARNALRQAVKVLELKINEVHANNVNLKKACEEERARAKQEAEEKLKECNARMSVENEVRGLKAEIAAIQQKGGGDARDGNESVEGFPACIADKEKEICRLKELLEADKKRADNEKKNAEKEIGRLKELLEVEKKRADNEKKNAEKERKKAAEALKLVEVEKSKVVDREMQISRVEAEKAAEYRDQLDRLEKEANEEKTELASQISAFKDATKKFEAEKRKLLKEKRNAESGMAKAKKMLEIEKQKVTEEKRRTDSEMVKVEKQKALAENNWKKFMEERNLVDQMSQLVEENKRTIEDLKQKITELSSPRKPTKMVGASVDVGEKAESTNVKLLKSQLKLEKLRAKYAKQKFKLEANRHSILRHEVGRLKTDFIPILRRLDMFDASFSPFTGRHNKTKSENIPYTQNSDIMKQDCNVDRSQMQSQFGNEPRETCCTTMETCDPLRKNMQCIPLLALSGRNYSESIPGIDSKLKLPVKGSSNTKLQSSAVNSSSESFSDGQLMGSQETTAFRVSPLPKLGQEVFHTRQGMCNSSDRFITENHRKRKHKHDKVEYVANLPSQNLSDVHGLFHRKEGKCLEGEREIPHNINNVHQTNGRVHKKRKKSNKEEMVTASQTDRDVEKGTEETKGEAYEDANICKQTCPGSYNLETTPACGERICDAANNFDSIISFGKVTDESYMKLFELDNTADEQRYQRAVGSLLSPSLPEIQFNEAFDIPFNEEALQDILSGKTELFPSPSLDVINSEIKANEQQVSVPLVSSDSQNKPTQASKTEVLKLPHMHTPENSRASCQVEDEVGPLHNRLPKFCMIFSNIEDNSIVSRILISTKACIARCSLATQTVWAVGSILTALKMEGTLSHKEKVAVLFTLMLFNFVMTATKTFDKLWDGNIFNCLNSYAEHIRTVLSDAETRILFIENYSLPELLGLIEDFLVEGKIIVGNIVPDETLSDCVLRSNDFPDCVNKLSNGVASSEQLLAGSIILASVCAATDHVGFTCEASYDILRLCKWDSLTVLTILHIFAYLGGEKFFDLDNLCSMVPVLKSLVIFLEGESLSVVTPCCLPTIDQLHTEFCTDRKCPFLEGAESIDTIACLLLEEIKNYLLHGVEQVALSDSRFMPDNNNARRWSNLEGDQKAINENCELSLCLQNSTVSAAQSGIIRNVAFCHFSDVLSLMELVANKMSWHWTDTKLVPQLMNILDSCVEENSTIAIIVLLGQLGRIGVDAGGYEERGVENLRCKLLAYLDHTSSMKAGISIQISAAAALFVFGLLPLDLETLVHTDTSLPAYSKSVSDNAETLRNWFSGLDEDKQKMLSSILRPQ